MNRQKLKKCHCEDKTQKKEKKNANRGVSEDRKARLSPNIQRIPSTSPIQPPFRTDPPPHRRLSITSGPETECPEGECFSLKREFLRKGNGSPSPPLHHPIAIVLKVPKKERRRFGRSKRKKQDASLARRNENKNQVASEKTTSQGGH